MTSIVDFHGITKIFGASPSPALDDVTLSISPGECLGLVGHNGAGKSTLMNILTGIFAPTAGSLAVDGTQQRSGVYDVRAANRLGVRAVFQELSLCLNLTVAENMRVFHPVYRGAGWRRRAGRAIMDTLDGIFPGHGISPADRVESLTLGQRQSLEIAKAFAPGGNPLRLLILDEPTSALDYHTARQLLEHINARKGGDVAFIYISHMLDEVLAIADRIVVMKDGRLAGGLSGGGMTRERMLALMGGTESREDAAGAGGANGTGRAGRDGEDGAGRELVRPRRAEAGKIQLTVREGEVVGLAGLAGHGQTELLVDLFDYRANPDYAVASPPTFVPGDRQRDGNFPLWSIINNITVLVYKRVRRYRLIDLRLEEKVSGRWRDSIAIRAPSMAANILSLSGGNQQKVLFARCLESDARLVLMDDPTRGVDVGTKEIIYRLISEECGRGRSFVWYTTEMGELRHCDRVYVFRDGEIVAEMPGTEATEEAVLRTSF